MDIMDMPLVQRCFGVFPPKYASYLIALFGIGSGGAGLSGIILYGLVEDSIVAHFIKTHETDNALKKVVLLTIGLTSLLLTLGNTFLFLGFTFSSKGCASTAVWIMLTMCILIILGIISAPLSCFFLTKTCIIKKMSTVVLVLGHIVLTFFLELWLYFMLVANTLANSL